MTATAPMMDMTIRRRGIDAGAAIVHNHIDVVMVPGEESAARYLEGWRPVFDARPDALIYPTTNFGPGVEGVIPSPLTAEEFDTVSVGGE